MQLGIGLGSNLGNRLVTLHAAFDWLRSLDPVARFSKIYESIPLDCPEGSPLFLNAAAEIEFPGQPEELLTLIQAQERTFGRPDLRPRNAPRPLDMDLLYAEDRVVNTERLVLPHPRLTSRVFVLQPLDDLCPDRIIPGTGRTVRQLLADLLAQGEPPCRPVA